MTASDGFFTAEATVTLTVLPPKFRRGDTNADGDFDVSDGVAILNYAFLGIGIERLCQDALDTNDDASITLTDTIFLLNHQFLGGAPPPPPYPGCGEDPTPADGIPCEEAHCD